MADFLWSLSAADLPDALLDWQRVTYGLRVPGTAAQRAALGEGAPQLAIWNFRGEQPLAGGLTALFAEYFRWLGPSLELILTRFEQDADGQLSWSAEMMQLDPATYTPDFAEHDAKIWGELSTDKLVLHYAFGEATQDWTLDGDTLQITTRLIGLAPEIMTRLGLHATEWKPDVPLDLSDSDALAALLRAWGELALRHEIVAAGFSEYSDDLQVAIQRVVSGAMTGSRFACWTACRALWPIAADTDSLHQARAEEALVSLGSAFPRVAWPGIALSLLEWERADYQRATDLLETAIESDPTVLTGWQLLAILYEELNQYERAIEVCREAIAGNVADAAIYYNLGSLLLDHGDDNDHNDNNADNAASQAHVEEALRMFAEAERRGLREPELYLRMMDGYEAAGDVAGLWEAFDHLIKNDPDRGVVWQIVEDADTYDDFEPGLQKLKAAADDYGLRAAYVRALIVLDRHEEATQAIPALRQLANDDYARAETAQLALEAAAPDFEDAYGEAADELEAGAVPNADVVGLLRDALAREPMFADGAVMLAQAYQLLDEPDAAMQVLSQTRELLPDHLELILSTADLLWATDDDMALWTMQDALNKHPNDVALLARLGEYYFEIGEDNLARDYLERAETLDPRHPELLRVQEQIARHVADQELELSEGEE